MPLVKIWNSDRTRRKASVVTTLREVVYFARKQFDYEDNDKLKVVFEEDGTEIESEDVFQCLLDESQFPGTILQVLPFDETWIPLSSTLNMSSSQSLTPSSSNATINSFDSSFSENSTLQTPSSSPSAIVNVESVANGSTNLSDFRIPWEKFSERFIRDCKAKIRPRPGDRREVVRQVVAAVRDIVENV